VALTNRIVVPPFSPATKLIDERFAPPLLITVSEPRSFESTHEYVIAPEQAPPTQETLALKLAELPAVTFADEGETVTESRTIPLIVMSLVAFTLLPSSKAATDSDTDPPKDPAVNTVVCPIVGLILPIELFVHHTYTIPEGH
jgi:hypothetical protein